jgi:SAM-dependent methyltransferase
MTTGKSDEAAGGMSRRDWATFQEPHFRPFYDAVFDWLRVGTSTRLLDVGCGAGGAAVLAAERGARVAGLDAMAEGIAVTRERLPGGDFQVGDMERLPWPDAAFDAVTGFNSFQFAPHPAVALREAGRVLAPGGRLGLVVWAPPAESQQPRVFAAVGTLAPPQPPDAPGPFALSAPGALEAALGAAGLRVVDQGAVPIVVHYPDADAACRAMLQGSAAVRAIQYSGEARVRQALLLALEAFRTDAGGYRFENRFRFVIAA